MSDQQKSFWNSVTQKASGLGKSISQKASLASKNITEKATEAAKQKATEMGEAISHSASEAGKKVMETATGSVESAKKQTQNWVENVYSDSEESGESTPLHDWSLDELYHIFVRSQTATYGGTQTVTLKTGKSYNVKIPTAPTEGSTLRLKGCGLQGQDAFLVLHTLLNPLYNIDRKINHLIVQAPIYDRTKVRCLEAYNRINAALPTEDFAALNLLDYLVFSSQIYSEVGQRYTIASQNSRLLTLEDCLQSSLTASQLVSEDQKRILSIYQYLRSGEAVPNLNTLEQLDAIILYSNLKPELKKYYLRASAVARVMTIDWIIVNEIDINQDIPQPDRPRYLAVYLQVRNDQEVVDLRTLETLDAWIEKANIPLICTAIYKLVRQGKLELNDDFEFDDFSESFKAITAVTQSIKESKTYSSSSENYQVNVTEIKPGMLAETAYNAVSRGGLGLLSGMPILKNSKTFIETAARIAIARISEIPSAEKIKLGIVPIANKAMINTAVGENWQAVSPLGTQKPEMSQLSGKDAYRTILMEIEGVMGLSEESDEPSLNLGLNVWKLLRGNGDRQRTIEDLERQMYS
ncbi:hypothetical protein [Limnoraphis robusta]|uniref:Uncharacterized protein n=1 Tax=Limnoraphis robusta CS-951 TaxID=1637645 RepID=A0A0F5YBJ5_9CYAN|nr:hypothetical protein [Limnoraphis robusta]KKD36281.1 hypothetical protein WN50_20680 [Limnoraphis robusta CS-951]